MCNHQHVAAFSVRNQLHSTPPGETAASDWHLPKRHSSKWRAIKTRRYARTMLALNRQLLPCTCLAFTRNLTNQGILQAGRGGNHAHGVQVPGGWPAARRLE